MPNNKKKLYLINVLLIVLSLAVSVLIAELILRNFTVFPIHGIAANRIMDDHTFFVFNPRVDGIDEDGFRNPKVLERAEIVALGDSHTFGNNVESNMSWPARLGEKLNKDVYNYGVMDFGIIQYRYLFDKALEKSPDTIIVGLFYQNDFAGVYCNTMTLPYWKENASKLGLENKKCANYEANKPKKEYDEYSKYIFDNSAIISALRYFADFYNYPLNNFFKDENKYEIKDESPLYEIKSKNFKIPFKVRLFRDASRLSRDDILNMEPIKNGFTVFNYMKEKASEKNVNLLIMMIPSREMVGKALAEKNNINLPDEVKRAMYLSSSISEIFTEFFEKEGFKYLDLIPYVLPTLEANLIDGKKVRNGNAIYINTHPDEEGYSTYVDAAIHGLKFFEAKDK